MKSCLAILSFATFLCSSMSWAQDMSPRNRQQGRLYEKLTHISIVQVPGSNETYAEGINDLCQIVGAYRDKQSGSNEIGFLYSNGTFSDIVFPGKAQTDAEGINDRGQIVGNFSSSNSSYFHAFVDSYGEFIQLNIPNAVSSAAYGINNAGEIVGYSIDPVGQQHGFICSSELFCKAVDAPGASLTDLLGINNAGQVAGWYGDTTPAGGLIFDITSGTFTTFSVPDSDSTTAIGINDSGQVVGHFSATGLPEQGFMYSDFSIFVLDVPKASNTYILGLNDETQVIGLTDSGSFIAKVTAPSEEDTRNGETIAQATNALGTARMRNVVYAAQKSSGTHNGSNCANAQAVDEIKSGPAVQICQTN